MAYVFVLIAIALRFLLYPIAFTPIGAALLYFGARAPRRRMWIPLAIVAAGDLVLSTFIYSYAITADLLVTWAWSAAIILLGGALRENPRPARLVGAALATSISFFLLSNFAVWVLWDMYPKTLSGLTACYVAAIPFFRHQPIADVVFTLVLFGTPALVAALRRTAQPRLPAA